MERYLRPRGNAGQARWTLPSQSFHRMGRLRPALEPSPDPGSPQAKGVVFLQREHPKRNFLSKQVGRKQRTYEHPSKGVFVFVRLLMLRTMFVFAFVFAKNVRLPPPVSRWLGGSNQAATGVNPPLFQHWSGGLDRAPKRLIEHRYKPRQSCSFCSHKRRCDRAKLPLLGYLAGIRHRHPFWANVGLSRLALKPLFWLPGLRSGATWKQPLKATALPA